MPGKQRYLRSIDNPKVGAFDAGGDALGTAAIAPPSQPAPGPPTNLLLTTSLERSAVSATARIAATWYPPAGVAPSSYIIQWSTGSGFLDGATNGQGAASEASTIPGLIPNTLYYVRVAAVVANQVSAWSESASITTDIDVTPPDPVTGGAAGFVGVGDLVVTWVNPVSANFRDAELKIYASSGGALLATLYSATERMVWMAAENRAATGGVGDPTLFIEVRARSWGGIFSTIGLTGPVTKAAPTAPGVTVDFTGADAVYTLTPPADTAYMSFTADTAVTARGLGVVGRYVYAFDQNRLDHSGTPDPVLAYSFLAIDGLNQASSATSGTATNAAPAAPTATLTQGAVSGLYATVTSAPAADFKLYRYTFKRDGAQVAVVDSAGATVRYEMQGAGDDGFHSWTVEIQTMDMFNQLSTAVIPSAVAFEALTLAGLRADVEYTDSIGTAPATLKAALADNNTTSGGVTYAA